MIRGMHKVCGYRGFLLEPYVTTLQLSCNCVSTKSAPNVQNLPRLPVPKLSDTLKKYLKTVKPFLNDEEFGVTSKLIKEFLEGGVGNKLQSLLEKRATEHLNWLEDWWLATAYLEYRDPVVVFSSPGLVFPFRKFNSQRDQLIYTAQTILAVVDYKLLIDGDKIPVEMMGKSPLDMQQYRKIFGTCRIPQEKRDKLSYNDSKYVTVMHNGHIFHLDIWGEDNEILNVDQIVVLLEDIVKNSSTPADNPVGVLTSEHRDTWAKAYSLLTQDGGNRASLADVERSLAVVCLDAASGLWDLGSKDARQTLAGQQTIHGGGGRANGPNRWFDKTVQFIVGADGVTGLTYEHSPAEGQPIAVLTDFLLNFVDQNKSNGRKPSASPKQPQKLNFNVDNQVSKMITTAKQNLDKLADDLDLNCFTFDKYGKNFIKSQKMSPDSFLQMAMQYAFYRLHNTPGAHYESAATRMYVGGRTETIRSCSPESIEFARAMVEGKSPKEQLAAMKAAINAHKDYTVQALQGFGVDRHLLGLKLIAKENGIELPKLYSDAGFTRSAHMRISTSQVACKCDGFMCYGPLVGDGYSTCYNPRDADVNFATAAFRRSDDSSVAQYRAALTYALTHMHDLLVQTAPSKL